MIDNLALQQSDKSGISDVAQCIFAAAYFLTENCELTKQIRRLSLSGWVIP
jgi:hypothetical protein